MNKEETINNILNGEEFYNLMQAYRHSPVAYQRDVTRSFEKVKSFLRKSILKELK